MSVRKVRSFGFVLPRYWAGMAGGAETLVGELAQRLSERGDNIEILTTCAKDNRTWENEFASGIEISGAVRVSRFPVDPRNLDSWVPLQIAISQGLELSVDDELEWMKESVNSTQLYQELRTRNAEFDLIFFAPYLFGTTFWGSLIAPQKSCLIPCLHDEHYAYTSIMGSMFRQVRGALFNAAPEQELAERLYGPLVGAEVGMGFEPPINRRVLKPYFAATFPYLIYVGRKETGKNVQVLIDHFIAAKEAASIASDIKLVIVGGGSFADLHRPEALIRDDIIDVAHVAEAEKQSLIASALALVQPSTNESFSIVLMEAWLHDVPVMVHSACAVTRDHVVRSGGGLYFADTVDFVAAVRELHSNQALRTNLGEAGHRYVKERYSWSAVLQRFDRAVDLILKLPLENLPVSERVNP